MVLRNRLPPRDLFREMFPESDIALSFGQLCKQKIAYMASASPSLRGGGLKIFGKISKGGPGKFQKIREGG